MNEDAKKKILANIENLSAEDVYGYIKRGLITLEDAKATGRLEASKRKIIEDLLAREKLAEEKDWGEAEQKNTIESYTLYLDKHPNGQYRKMAEFAITTLKKHAENESKTRQNILNRLRSNPNDGFTPQIILNHINKGDVEVNDLAKIGIPSDVIDALDDFNSPDLTLGNIPDVIPPGFTEVYFWGVPGSGKTCALSGILSHAHESGLLETGTGPGYHYMNQLKNIFRSDIGFLPAPTNTEATQCLPFELYDRRGKKHPIALIELSGEIFRCYYYQEARLKFPDAGHVKTFETVKRFLSGENRKVHFFVFDLTKDPKKLDEYNMCQDDYLSAAQTYFKNNNIFKEYTDVIHIIATKSDTLDCSVEERGEKARDHLNKYYSSFINVLKDSCRQYKINDSNDLTLTPFSLGDVYFNSICKFNNNSSSQILEILKAKTAVWQGKSILKSFFNK